MHAYSAAVLMGLLMVAEGAYVSTTSCAHSAPNPTIQRYEPESIPTRLAPNRLLREPETTEASNEDRVVSIHAGIEKLSDLIKTGVSKVHGYLNLGPSATRDQPADEILRIYKLDDGIEKALVSPNLKAMESHVKELSTKNRKSEASVIGILTSHYGDDAVAKALVTAQKTLRHDDYLALASPKMEVLDDYMKLINRVTSGQETLLNVLTKGFGGEQTMAKLLLRGKEEPQTRELATALQNALLNKWVTDKFQPESVLKKLKLDRDLMNALSDPTRHTLTSYIAVFNTRNPGKKASFIGTLSAHYGDEMVANVLIAASRNGNTRRMANQLRTEQLSDWLNNQKSADEVFSLLKLRADLPNIDGALASGKLKLLEDYIKLFNREKAGDETLLKTLTTGFDGESNLAKALLTAEINPHSNKMVVKLQGELLNQWLLKGLKPESVLKNLGLDRGMKEVLSDPNRHFLTKYIWEYNSRNRFDRTSLIWTLSAHYGDDVVARALAVAKGDSGLARTAAILQRQQLEGWLSSGKSADDVFTLLRIGADDFLPLNSQNLETLEDFVWLLNLKNRRIQTNIFTVVENKFGGDVQLARAVVKALNEADERGLRDSVGIASRYRSKLFGRWFDKSIEPKDVYAMILKVNGASADALEKSIVSRYTAFYKKRLAKAFTFDSPRRL
ncbi:hypothetical protein PInf_008354 [Phytophthora infestans]|nr:hypothetical protein PInf_008354 [Phytophthora infestans]